MYVVPVVLLVPLAVIAVAWSPLLAVMLAIPLFVAFLAYAGIGRG